MWEKVEKANEYRVGIVPRDAILGTGKYNGTDLEATLTGLNPTKEYKGNCLHSTSRDLTWYVAYQNHANHVTRLFTQSFDLTLNDQIWPFRQIVYYYFSLCNRWKYWTRIGQRKENVASSHSQPITLSSKGYWTKYWWSRWRHPQKSSWAQFQCQKYR